MYTENIKSAKLKAYNKVLSVLESCENALQLEVASNMVNNYQKLYGNNEELIYREALIKFKIA